MSVLPTLYPNFKGPPNLPLLFIFQTTPLFRKDYGGNLNPRQRSDIYDISDLSYLGILNP